NRRLCGGSAGPRASSVRGARCGHYRRNPDEPDLPCKIVLGFAAADGLFIQPSLAFDVIRIYTVRFEIAVELCFCAAKRPYDLPSNSNFMMLGSCQHQFPMTI
ncbi:MAG: hypothetical protein RLO21_07645, partial [Nitratireductor sp.]